MLLCNKNLCILKSISDNISSKDRKTDKVSYPVASKHKKIYFPFSILECQGNNQNYAVKRLFMFLSYE